MTLPAIALLITQMATLSLGVLVYLNNPKRLVNRHFLILSLNLALWAYCVFRVVQSTGPAGADFWIRAAFFITAFFPASFTLLLSAIRHYTLSWPLLYKKHLNFILLSVFASLLPLAPFFMHGIIMPTPSEEALGAVPEAIYGMGYYVFVAYFIATCVTAGKTFYQVFRESSGIQRYELQFILYGFGASFFVGALSSLVLPIILGSNQTSQYGPLGIILLDGIVAYGITTRKILGIATILQKLTSYALLTTYLVIVYYVTWFISKYAISLVSAKSSELPYLLAAFAVALSMLPAHGRFQAVSYKLIATGTMDVSETMKQASSIFQSVSTIDALIDHFSSLLMQALRTDSITVLIKNNDGFTQQYPATKSGDQDILESSNPIYLSLINTKEPISRDVLARLKRTPLINDTDQQLQERGCRIAIGIFSKGNLNGIILLGERQGRKIYDRTEQDTLQILCNQFAVALENAQLYTEVQDSKIRNEIMLDQLVSGVIVANPERKISLFNHEAQRITGIQEYAAIGKEISDLPKPICHALKTTLQRKTGDRNVEARLFEQDETRKSLNIRMGTTYLLGHDQKPMGALLVFTDMTELKTLEEQVRRSDQLSSVGTLAAGMAHEIKNPLVTIKTFTQLLPERYSDDDFRKDFSSLVAHEVSRIDGIVNELLSFSKPTKPHLIPIHLHDVIGQILKLTREQMSQNNIVVTDNQHAAHDQILGDAKLLSQALINLTLNAVEAIGEEGTITIGTMNCQYRFANGEDPDQSVKKECIRLQISDSGQGIAPDHIKQIFDPFFTRKSEGTGMGLSVAHGIIQEHHAVIDVESEMGKGSTFHIYIPLIEEDVA